MELRDTWSGGTLPQEKQRMGTIILRLADVYVVFK
jgi:hypothetical protein